MNQVLAWLAFLLIVLVLLLWMLPNAISGRVSPSGPPVVISNHAPAPLSQPSRDLVEE